MFLDICPFNRGKMYYDFFNKPLHISINICGIQRCPHIESLILWQLNGSCWLSAHYLCVVSLGLYSLCLSVRLSVKLLSCDWNLYQISRTINRFNILIEFQIQILCSVKSTCICKILGRCNAGQNRINQDTFISKTWQIAICADVLPELIDFNVICGGPKHIVQLHFQ